MWLPWGVCLRGSHMPHSRVSHSFSHRRACLGEDLLPGSLMWLLVGFAPQRLLGQQAQLFAGWGCPHFLVTEGSSQYGSLFHKTSREKSQEERVAEIDITVFCYVILEVTSHHICRIPFMRRELPGPAHTLGEETVRELSTRRPRSVFSFLLFFYSCGGL